MVTLGTWIDVKAHIQKRLGLILVSHGRVDRRKGIAAILESREEPSACRQHLGGHRGIPRFEREQPCRGRRQRAVE
jgi:hypothetical protein